MCPRRMIGACHQLSILCMSSVVLASALIMVSSGAAVPVYCGWCWALFGSSGIVSRFFAALNRRVTQAAISAAGDVETIAYERQALQAEVEARHHAHSPVLQRRP